MKLRKIGRGSDFYLIGILIFKNKRDIVWDIGIQTCDECGSEFYTVASKFKNANNVLDAAWVKAKPSSTCHACNPRSASSQ